MWAHVGPYLALVTALYISHRPYTGRCDVAAAGLSAAAATIARTA